MFDMFNVKQIKPKVAKISDKYSWNIYSYLNRHKKDQNLRVYYINNQFDPYNMDLSKVLIGFKVCQSNDYIGNTLNQIVREGNRNITTFCFCKFGGFNTDEFINITEIFIKEYLERGRCFLFKHDNIWLLGDENRYTYISNNSRRCNWCGRWEYRKIEKVVTIERKEKWRGEIG